LDRQKGRLLDYCRKQKYKVEYVFEEIGSGMSDTRCKLNKMFKLAAEKKISRIVVEHKDRLCRFNFGVYKIYFESHGVNVEWVDDVLPKSYEAELVEDMLSLMATCSAKIYGKRSAENRKKKIELEKNNG
jgi:predicted site-specific integrase-resolvase